MRKTITRQGIRAAAGADQFFQHCTNRGLKTRFVTKITKANKRCEFTPFLLKKKRLISERTSVNRSNLKPIKLRLKTV